MMKNRFTFIAFTIICGLILTNCGGGSSRSGLKKNQYLGQLPAIYADYNVEKKAYEDKIEEQGRKLLEGGEKNKDKVMKLIREEEETTKKMKEKLETAVKTETAKLNGVEIPVSYSENLKSSGEQFYTISGVKLVDDNGKLKMSYIISAKDDFEVPTYKGGDYSTYFRFYATDGTTILKSVFMPVRTDTKPILYTAGQLIYEGQMPISMSNKPESYAEFAGIEFTTKDEYSK